MKVLLFGKAAKNIESLITKLGFDQVSKNPDVIISYGGDGTLLSAEKEFPTVPKLPVRNSQFCNKCPDHEDKVVLQALLEDKLKIRKYRKLETEIDGQKLYALNDFVVRNDSASHTIRFRILPLRHLERSEGSINSQLFIGDGIVVSTPFGSTGYFKSITRKSFKKGFALTFNNITEKADPIFFKDSDKVIFKLVRGRTILTFDNSYSEPIIPEGKEIIFKLSNQSAKIYEDTSLRCPNCQVIRG